MSGDQTGSPIDDKRIVLIYFPEDNPIK